jgi:hypothetical protein
VQQLSSYTQLSSINFYGTDGLRISHPIGTPKIRLNSSCQNDLFWASRAAETITTIRDHWRGVAAQLLHRRDEPDGSMTFATDAIAMLWIDAGATLLKQAASVSAKIVPQLA